MFHYAASQQILELALEGLWTIYELHGQLPKGLGHYLPWGNEELGVPKSQELNDIELLELLDLKVKEIGEERRPPIRRRR